MSEYLEAINDLLIEWGRAARSDSVRIGMKPGVLSNLKGSTVKSASIEQDNYENIDRIVSTLKYVDPVLYDVAGYFYVQARQYEDISRRMRCSKRTVSQYKQSVIAYVAGSLNDI
jgi:hypothetical protein